MNMKDMKKIYAFLIAVMLMLAVSCGGNKTTKVEDPVTDSLEMVETVETIVDTVDVVEPVEPECPCCPAE